MKLAQLVDQGLVLLGYPVKSLDEGMVAAMDAIAGKGIPGVDREVCLSKLRQRMDLGGLCMPTGICIAHARLKDIEGVTIAALVPQEALEAPDKAPPVRLLWVILSPEATPTLYLKAVSDIVGLSRDQGFMRSLLLATSGSQFVARLDEVGRDFNMGLTVSDIMTREVIAISPDASVREVLDLMFAHNLRYVPVGQKGSEVVGEVSILDLISAGIPEYARQVGNLNFLRELEPLEHLLKHESEIKVREVMKVPARTVASDTSVIEVALEMATSKKRHFAVVEDGRLVGVVSSMDILSKVLRS